jgi:hypothetical protein
MSSYTALLDANVLYPAPVRDLLLQLAVVDVYKARWTADIHREWIENLLENEPHRDRAKLERTRDLMDSNTRDALVTGYESLILSLHFQTKTTGMFSLPPLSAVAMSSSQPI